MELQKKLEEKYGKEKGSKQTLKRYVSENLSQIESLMRNGYTVRQIFSVLTEELGLSSKGSVRYFHSLLYLARKERKKKMEDKN